MVLICSSVLSQQRRLSHSYLFHQEPSFSAGWIQLGGNEQFWTGQDIFPFPPESYGLIHARAGSQDQW
jgi:hypothetical protein